MTKTLTYTAVVVLAVIAVVLGYKIYHKTTGVQTPSGQQTQDTTVPQTGGNSQPQIQSPTIDSAAIAEDRKKISVYPGPSAPDAQKREFQEIIDRNAQFSDTLDITKCESSPMVLKVRKEADIKLVNNGSTGNAILFGPGKQYDVAAKSSTTMTVNIDVGVNLYRCIGISGNPIIGAFVVTE